MTEQAKLAKGLTREQIEALLVEMYEIGKTEVLTGFHDYTRRKEIIIEALRALDSPPSAIRPKFVAQWVKVDGYADAESRFGKYGVRLEGENSFVYRWNGPDVYAMRPPL